MNQVYEYAFQYNALLLKFVNEKGDSLLREKVKTKITISGEQIPQD